MTPSERISASVDALHTALADLREEREIAERRQQERLALLAQTEGTLRVLAVRSGRARGLRHLQPSEDAGPRARAVDGEGEPAPLSERTLRSLQVMGVAGVALPTVRWRGQTG